MAVALYGVLENGTLALIRLIAGKRIARLAYRYSNRLYPEPHKGLRRLRFYLRSLTTLSQSKRWFEQLSSDQMLWQCLRYEPEMAEKLHRPYRRTGISAEAKLQLVLDHVRSSQNLGWSDLIVRAYAGSALIAQFEDKNHHTWMLTLTRPGQFGKEGELALNLVDGDVRIYSAAFSFRGDVHRELDVGCIQGPEAEDARQLIRDLTRSMHGLRPRSLILEAIRGLAVVSACSRIRVVGNANHIYRSLRKRRAISFDYDEFCAEVTGVVPDGRDWVLPVQADVRPLSEVASKKRAETARRRSLLESVGNQIVAKVQRLTTG